MGKKNIFFTRQVKLRTYRKVLVVCFDFLRLKGSPSWMTSPIMSAIKQSNRKTIVLLFAIVRRECVECIAQGHVTGVTPYCVIVTSSSKGSLLDASKIKSAPIELKIGTGMFRVRPTRLWRRFYVKMTSSRYQAYFNHLLGEK